MQEQCTLPPQILDPCCGGRMMYFQRQSPAVLFGDLRHETLTVIDRSHGKADGTRTIHISPDMRMDFRALPFPDRAFKLVVFDPPHLVRAGARSWLAAKYGKLGEDWRTDLRTGFTECFRVLDWEGTLIFKWSEVQISVRQVLTCFPQRPVFGHTTTANLKTHWMVFYKSVEEA